MLKSVRVRETGQQAPNVDKPTVTPRKRIQSVERALAILEILSQAKGEMRLGELAKAVGLNKSTCHNLLSTLIDHRYVGQSVHTRTYFLGNRIMELSGSRVGLFNLVERAMPAVRDLNDATGETVHLAALQGDEVITLRQLDSRHAVRVVTDDFGKSNAIHATAIGKAILAWLPEAEFVRILDRKGQPAITDRTITDRDALIEDLRLVRRKGVAIDNEEFQPGVICIGAVIRDPTGGVIGSFSCSLPTMRAQDDHIANIEREIRHTAKILAAAVGGAGPSDTEAEQDNGPRREFEHSGGE